LGPPPYRWHPLSRRRRRRGGGPLFVKGIHQRGAFDCPQITSMWCKAQSAVIRFPFGEKVVSDVHVRTLMRAAEIVGGPQELAFKLKVTPSHLSLWIGGLEPCPGHVFLIAVDLVLA